MVACRICKGDRVCVECDGIGERPGLPPPCDECKGDGECYACDGTGYDSDIPAFLQYESPSEKDKRRDHYNRRH